MSLIGEIHEHAHALGYVRVHTDIRVGTRTDKNQTAQDKMDVVLKKLGA